MCYNSPYIKQRIKNYFDFRFSTEKALNQGRIPTTHVGPGILKGESSNFFNM